MTQKGSVVKHGTPSIGLEVERNLCNSDKQSNCGAKKKISGESVSSNFMRQNDHTSENLGEGAPATASMATTKESLDHDMRDMEGGRGMPGNGDNLNNKAVTKQVYTSNGPL